MLTSSGAKVGYVTSYTENLSQFELSPLSKSWFTLSLHHVSVLNRVDRVVPLNRIDGSVHVIKIIIKIKHVKFIMINFHYEMLRIFPFLYSLGTHALRPYNIIYTVYTSASRRMSLNIFLIYNIYCLCCLIIDFYDLSAWRGCWFVVYIRRIIYTFLDVCPLIIRLLRGVGRLGPVNRLITPVGWL